MKMGSATVERWYQDYFEIKNREFKNAAVPRVIGIDEHFFTRKQGFATTIADLHNRKVFDVTLGRSEASLRAYLRGLHGKERVRVVVMDPVRAIAVGDVEVAVRGERDIRRHER